MKGNVTRGRLSYRNVSRAFVSTLVALFLVSWVFFFVEPASALYVGEDIGCEGYNTKPVGVNDLDQVAGFRGGVDEFGDFRIEAIVYDPGTEAWTVLPDFGDGYGAAQDISEDGDVVGFAYDSSTGRRRGTYWPSGYDRMVVLEGFGVAKDSYPLGMNDVREAVGYTGKDWNITAVMWSLDPDATSILPLDLGVVEGSRYTYAEDINNNHEVVGYYLESSAFSSRYQAFYCAGYGSPLQRLLPLYDGPVPTEAWSISDSGMIVGYSYDSEGKKRAVAWLPPYDALPVDLGQIVGVPSYAEDVNTGEMVTGTGPGGAFVLDFSSGVYEYLTPPPGIVGGCKGYAINDRGHVAGGGWDTSIENHTILWTPDSPPVAAFTATISGFNVTVNASSSYDAEGEIAVYSWNFGDGTYGTEMVMTHTYATAGPYTITLWVNDSAGQGDYVSLQISTLETPETETAELVVLIEECTSFDQDVKDVLTAKVLHALNLIEARKKGGDAGPANILLSFDNMVSNYVLAGKIASEYEAWDLIAQADFVISLLAESHLIGGVPVYTWHHGCGPTATGMLMGYWDSMGFGDLVKGEQGAEMFQTDDVNSMIASESHVDDYVYPLDGWVEQPDGTEIWVDLQPDKSELGGATDDDCLADFMHTSRSADGLVYGQSYASMVDDALLGYTEWASRGMYVGTAATYHQGSLSWEDFKSEVDAVCPMVFVVDWNGDGETDHLVAVLGYCEVGNAKLYAFYSTWDNNIWWAIYDIMQEGNFYGVYASVTYSVSMA